MTQPQPRVLVITTAHSIYTLIQRPLKAQGFHTTHTISFDRAQTYLEDETHHLIILDLTNTKQQQIDDYHRLQQRATIPLVVLIDGESEQNNGTITDISTDDYMYYPFDPENLITHVRNALRPRLNQATQRSNLYLGTITIHFDECQAIHNGQKVHLTRTEWKLLETLALHQGKTLTYRTLLQHVWGDAYHDEHSYVHTYISQLRRKLEPDPTKPRYLLTEVGVGYRLNVSTNGDHSPESTATIDSTSEKITETPLNLTTPPTKLFGRETDIQTIRYLLDQPDVRLLTLTGPPGVGKTRLAQHIAETIQHQFTNGLYTVSLAPLRDHSLVVSAIAQTVGAQESAHQTIHQALMQTIKGQQALLFLDNFEHVPEAASLITELIAIAPNLTILITSRTPLRIAGEQEYLLPPLPTPDPTISVSSETLAHNPAVALFVRRSHAVKPDFVLTTENAPAVAAICTRLDGLPLAIELAAAQSKLFSPQALLARLDQCLALLSHNTTDAPERHQTLRAAIDWSYQLLRPEEQRILVGLSVFAGGCTLEALTSVLNNNQQLLPEPSSSTSLSPDPQTLTMINHLTTLVNHSLVQVTEDTNNESRFTLLETIREYAWGKLAESSGVEQIQQRFVEYYLQMIEKASPELEGPQQKWWLSHLTEEIENIRTAFTYTLDKRELNLAGRLITNLWWFCYLRGYFSEGQTWINSILENKDRLSIELQGHILTGSGFFTWKQGDPKRGQFLLQESLLLFQKAENINGEALSLKLLGSLMIDQGIYDQATTFLEKSLYLYTIINDKIGIVRVLNNLGGVATFKGEYEQALLFFKESHVLSQETGNKIFLCTTLSNLSMVLQNQEKYDQALFFAEQAWEIDQELGLKYDAISTLSQLGNLELFQGCNQKAKHYFKQGLILSQELKNKYGIVSALINLSRSALVEQDIRQAADFCEKGLTIARELNSKTDIVEALINIGIVRLTQGNYEDAKAAFAEGLILSQETKHKRNSLESMDGLASVLIAVGLPVQGIYLWSASTALRQILKASRWPIDEPIYKVYISTASEKLEAVTLQQAWDEGQKMSLEEAIDYALEHVTVNEREVAS